MYFICPAVYFLCFPCSREGKLISLFWNQWLGFSPHVQVCCHTSARQTAVKTSPSVLLGRGFLQQVIALSLWHIWSQSIYHISKFCELKKRGEGKEKKGKKKKRNKRERFCSFWSYLQCRTNTSIKEIVTVQAPAVISGRSELLNVTLGVRESSCKWGTKPFCYFFQASVVAGIWSKQNPYLQSHGNTAQANVFLLVCWRVALSLSETTSTVLSSENLPEQSWKGNIWRTRGNKLITFTLWELRGKKD